MTPWQLGVYAAAAQEEQLTRLWHLEALRRCEKLPRLADFLHPSPDPPPGADGEALMAYLQSRSQRTGT